jgi:uncharacterized protein (TIGR02246 family)
MKPLGRVAGLLILIAIPAIASSTDAARVEDALRNYERLLRAKDSAGLAAMYAPDGELLEPGMDPLKGPEAIRKFLDSFADVQIESATMTADATEAWPDHALQWGHYAQRVIPPGQPAGEYTGRFVIEWTRRPGGAWLVRRLLVQPSPSK